MGGWLYGEVLGVARRGLGELGVEVERELRGEPVGDAGRRVARRGHVGRREPGRTWYARNAQSTRHQLSYILAPRYLNCDVGRKREERERESGTDASGVDEGTHGAFLVRGAAGDGLAVGLRARHERGRNDAEKNEDETER